MAGMGGSEGGAAMKALVMTLAMSLAFLTFGHPSEAAEFASNRTIGELRRIMMTENEWIYYAGGVGAALGALDGWCTEPLSVGEAAAYLRFTAAEWKTAVQAIKDLWQSRNCRTESGSIGSILGVGLLFAIRTATNLDYLRSIIEASGEDEMTKFMRTLATDRLRELGEIPKVPPPAR
jgi:hypothetical protein